MSGKFTKRPVRRRPKWWTQLSAADRAEMKEINDRLAALKRVKAPLLLRRKKILQRYARRHRPVAPVQPRLL